MEIQTSVHGGSVTAVLVGELDADNAERLETTLRDALGMEYSSLVLEASQLSFMDSSGIAVMLALRALMVEERNGSFRLCNPTPNVHRALEITGLLTVLSVG